MDVQRIGAILGTAALATRTEGKPDTGAVPVLAHDADLIDVTAQIKGVSTGSIRYRQRQLDPQTWEGFAGTAISGGLVYLPSLQCTEASMAHIIPAGISNQIMMFFGSECFADSEYESADLEDRRERYGKLAALLDEWAAEPGNYDEQASVYLDKHLRAGELRFTEELE